MQSADSGVLIGTIMRLKELLESHLDRDVSVTDLLSGAEPVWVCQRELEDLRETLSSGAEGVEVKVLGVTTIDVSREEQIELFKKWLRDANAS